LSSNTKGTPRLFSAHDPQHSVIPQEKKELAKLRREVRTLRMERDFLKNRLRAELAPVGRETPSGL
jgi:transposase